MDFILPAVIALGVIAFVAAAILYVCSRKFAVKEDPRIALVADILPQANCGGCGFPGCSGMADALVKGADVGSIEGLTCPVGGAECMSKIAEVLGMSVAASEPKVAVVRCGGTCAMRPKTILYDGLRTCTAMNSTGSGETACGYGCLGGGDCERVCNFDAIHVNPETGIAEVDAEKCTSCGACVKACPRHIIELRNVGKRERRVYVACMNKDKGAVAKKTCSATCIGCGKCQKVCKFDAIKVENNLSYIDYEKCKACGLCARECPTGAIKCTFTLPPLKPKSAEDAKENTVRSINLDKETKEA